MSTAQNTGVGDRFYGGWFEVFSVPPIPANNAIQHFGIFARAPLGPAFGTPTQVSSFAGFFDGDVFINSGTISTPGFVNSDANLKTNIDTISNALAIIDSLKPRSFNFVGPNSYGLNLPNQKQYGLIAQDVEQVLPEIVNYTHKPQLFDTSGVMYADSITYRTVNYSSLTGILIKGIQEINAENSDLEEKVDSLTDAVSGLQDQINTLYNMITACCENNSQGNNMNYTPSNGTNVINTELKDIESIVLDQNVPNPFAEQTTISFFLPENTGRAQLLFYNAAGKLINSVDINQKGKGQINVFANDLSNGIYTYALIVDGKVIDTKKMVKNQ